MAIGQARARDGDAAGGDRYREAGVDIDAGTALVERLRPLARSTRRPGADAGLGGFGAFLDPRAAGFADPLLVATTDGVGTKLLLALEAGRLRGVGRDLVAMCVNDLAVQGARPLLFLDYLATGRLEVERAMAVLEGVAEACREAGCALAGGETAEMPGLYAPGHLDLAGFALGAVERGRELPRPDQVRPGDVVLGCASSGLHSNGFALVRKVLRDLGLGPGDPAPFAPGRPLGEALLEPTRLYVGAALAAAAAGVAAMAHVTGGGLVENLPRVLPAGALARLDARAWPLPPAIAWLAAAGGLGARDLLRTFNCGIGLAAVAPADRAGEVEAALRAAGEATFRVGRIEAGVAGAPARVEVEGVGAAWGVADGSPS